MTLGTIKVEIIAHILGSNDGYGPNKETTVVALCGLIIDLYADNPSIRVDWLDASFPVYSRLYCEQCSNHPKVILHKLSISAL